MFICLCACFLMNKLWFGLCSFRNSLGKLGFIWLWCNSLLNHVNPCQRILSMLFARISWINSWFEVVCVSHNFMHFFTYSLAYSNVHASFLVCLHPLQHVHASTTINVHSLTPFTCSPIHVRACSLHLYVDLINRCLHAYSFNIDYSMLMIICPRLFLMPLNCLDLIVCHLFSLAWHL